MYAKVWMGLCKTATLTEKPTTKSEQQRILANNEIAIRASSSQSKKALSPTLHSYYCSRTITHTKH